MILVQTGTMEVFGYISIIAYYPPWGHHRVGIIQLILLLIAHLVLQLEMVKLVWIIGPPTFTPIKLIVGLMVFILCHIGVGNPLIFLES